MKPSFILLCVVGGFGFATPGGAQTPLRSPQVPFRSSPLQQFINLVDPGIQVTADQRDLPNWAYDAFGGLGMDIELRATNGDALGLYNTDDANSALFELLPAGARAGWYATIDFNYQTGLLTTARFDESSNLLGVSYFNGAHRNHFGFYAQGPCGTWFSGDARNAPPGPQALVFDPFPFYPWVCFETCPYNAATSTFTGVILQVGYIGGDNPARNSTWGQLKSRYR